METAQNDSLDIKDALDYSRSFMMWDAPPNPNDHRKPGHISRGATALVFSLMRGAS